MTTLSVFTQLYVNEKRMTADFHRAFLKMVELHIYQEFPDDSIETSKCYLNFNEELR